MEDKKYYKKGFKSGILIGIFSTLLTCAIIFGVILSLNVEKKIADSVTQISISKDAVKKINNLVKYIDKYFLFDYDETKMEDALYKAVLSSLDDPYSQYYTPEEYQSLSESTSGVYYGIGVVVSQDLETGYVKVVQPYDNAPGSEAGIMKDDLITEVAGQSVKNMDLDLVVDLIKGDEGTKVNIKLLRGTETISVDVERRKITVETVSHEMKDGKIGYISILQFDGVTKDQFIAAIDDLNKQGMEGLVIDIRNNPGGRLDVVVDMLDYVLPEGILVYTEDKYGNREDYKSDSKCNLDCPCVVLVNENSASASEIFSGAMQDYKKATIMGTQTFGKGIVQSIVPLDDGSAIKLTVENYFTPNGNNIHGIGITPDVVVELDTDKYQEDKTDNQLEEALKYLSE